MNITTSQFHPTKTSKLFHPKKLFLQNLTHLYVDMWPQLRACCETGQAVVHSLCSASFHRVRAQVIKWLVRTSLSKKAQVLLLCPAGRSLATKNQKQFKPTMFRNHLPLRFEIESRTFWETAIFLSETFGNMKPNSDIKYQGKLWNNAPGQIFFFHCLSF